MRRKTLTIYILACSVNALLSGYINLIGGFCIMSRKKISTTIYITEDQNEKLKLLNKKTKVPVAEYIRQGIDLVLDQYKNHLPGQMSF
jgi:hypothetical protein